jgi:hypothetical protein
MGIGQMKLTRNDFEQLTINSTNWSGSASAWKEQEGRFEDADYNEAEREVDYSHSRAYWAQDYPAVLFIKAFLESLNHEHRVYWDTADDSYMITTNYGGVL